MAASRRHSRWRSLRWLIAALAVLLALPAAPASATGSSVASVQSSYAEGNLAQFTYSTSQPSSTNWVGIFKAGDPVDSAHLVSSTESVGWEYAPNYGGTASMALNVWAGNYVAYLLYNNTYAQLAGPASFSVTSARSLSLDQAAYVQGASALLRATYSTGYSATPTSPSDVNNDWVGIYRAGDPVDSAHDLAWSWARDLNGTAGVNISSLAVGSYVAYLFYNNGYSQLASASFTVASSSNALSLDRNSYGTGSTFTATWSTGSPQYYNWVAIVPAGAQPSSYQAWSYVSTYNSSGSTPVNISNLSAGSWDAYLLYNDGYTVLAGPVRFTVVPSYDHVFMIMMENTSYADVSSDVNATNSNMPYLKSIKAQGAWFSNYHATTHPSDENYLAIAGGETYTSGSYYWPRIKDPNQNIADRLEASSKSWKAYEQGMGTPCNAPLNSDGSINTTAEHQYDSYYGPDDAPFINYTDISGNSARCQAHLFDTSQMSTDLQYASTTPAFSWIAADDYYDGEASGQGNQTSRHIQDGWLGTTVNQIMTSPAWTTQRSLLIITWDESNTTPYTADNNVATLVLGSQNTVTAGKTSGIYSDHYSTGATIDDTLGIAPVTSNDRGATPLVDAFTP